MTDDSITTFKPDTSILQDLWDLSATMAQLNTDGFTIQRNAVSMTQCQSLGEKIEATLGPIAQQNVRHIHERVPLVNVLIQSNPIQAIARSALLHLSGPLQPPIFQRPPTLVRSLYLNKTADTNWGVAWHQDRTIALRDRVNRPGWRPWTIKDGVHHVQPPLAVLEQMVTLRLHLDTTTSDNGCLWVIPQSHQHGLLSSEVVQHLSTSRPAIPCSANIGDIWIMRPHLLHSSQKALVPSSRRVIHLEFSSYTLPKGLSWLYETIN